MPLTHKIINCTFLLCVYQVLSVNSFQLKVSKMQDFPSRKDLTGYLRSLERIIDFSYEQRVNFSSSYGFGLLLINVNLKPFIRDVSISEKIQNKLKRLLSKNYIILQYFNDYQDKIESNDRRIWKYLKSWSKRGKKFEISQGWHSSPKNYPDWKTYVKYVENIDRWHPHPKQSDICLAALAENKGQRKCVAPGHCYKMLLTGTNFGYALTHRLLFLLLGFYNRGCTVFSPNKDRSLRNEFCRRIYNEAEYIADNGLKHVDLIFEQIALCALDGHAEFIRRSWLTNLLRYQTPYGCFSQLPPNQTEHEDGEVIWKHNIMNGACNAHVTATAAGSLAAATRFVLENIGY